MRLALVTVMLSGCTLLTGPTHGDMHSPAQPALLVCVLSSCNGQFNDKTARAGDDVANADKSGTVAQTSDNAVVIPTKVTP